MIGVYIITNKINNKSYIGQSINIKRRFREHLNEMDKRHRGCYEYPLYRALRKYGVENFSFNVLEECPKEDLNSREEFWINHYNTVKNGYNQLEGGNQPVYGSIGESHHFAKLTDEEVYRVREEYNKRTPFEEVFANFGKGMSRSGFLKIWHGYTRKEINSKVYTKENKEYWEYAKNISGSRLFSDEDIIDIRTRKNSGEDKESVFSDYRSVAKKKDTFNDIWSGKRYRHIVVEPVSTISESGE